MLDNTFFDFIVIYLALSLDERRWGGGGGVSKAALELQLFVFSATFSSLGAPLYFLSNLHSEKIKFKLKTALQSAILLSSSQMTCQHCKKNCKTANQQSYVNKIK